MLCDISKIDGEWQVTNDALANGCCIEADSGTQSGALCSFWGRIPEDHSYRAPYHFNFDAQTATDFIHGESSFTDATYDQLYGSNVSRFIPGITAFDTWND